MNGTRLNAERKLEVTSLVGYNKSGCRNEEKKRTEHCHIIKRSFSFSLKIISAACSPPRRPCIRRKMETS
jgi:hypothetical protein